MTTGGWRAAGILFAVFGAGALAGAASMEVFREPASAEVSQRGGRDGPSGGSTRSGDSERFVKYMQTRVDLTEEQAETVREILNRNGEEARSLYESIRPRLESGVEETRAQIREVLTAEQLAKFDQFLTDERGRRRRGGNRSDATPREKSDGSPMGARGGSPSAPSAVQPRPRGGQPESEGTPGPQERQRRDHDHRGSGSDAGDGTDATMGERLGPIIRA